MPVLPPVTTTTWWTNKNSIRWSWEPCHALENKLFRQGRACLWLGQTWKEVERRYETANYWERPWQGGCLRPWQIDCKVRKMRVGLTVLIILACAISLVEGGLSCGGTYVPQYCVSLVSELTACLLDASVAPLNFNFHGQSICWVFWKRRDFFLDNIY